MSNANTLSHLITDISRIGLAPTLTREVTAQVVTLIVVVASAILLIASPVLRWGVVGLVVMWSLTRVIFAARRGDRDVSDAARR